MPQQQASRPRLNGKLVINLSRVLGGPFCFRVLGDHGAGIIHLESLRGD